MEKESWQNDGESEHSLAQFQNEIAALVAKEASGEIESGHFLVPGVAARKQNPDFHLSVLTEEDRNIWKAINERTITMEMFRHYTNGVAELDKADPTRPSRMIFSDFAANIVSPILAGKEMGWEEE